MSIFHFPTEGGQYLCSGEGMFRRPSEGQSLISYLSEQDFGSCADLEKVRNLRGYWRAHELGDLAWGAMVSFVLKRSWVYSGNMSIDSSKEKFTVKISWISSISGELFREHMIFIESKNITDFVMEATLVREAIEF